MYDLNQILHDYTVEVMNRLKGLALLNRVPEELWTEVCNIIQEAGNKTIPEKKKCREAKWLSQEALQMAERKKKKKVKSNRERVRYTQLNIKFQRIARRDKQAFINEQGLKIEESNRMRKLETSARKLVISK